MFSLFKKKEPTVKLTQYELEQLCKDILLNVIENYEDDYNQAIFYKVWEKSGVTDGDEFDELINKCKASYEKIKSATLFGDVLL